jgi:hypothetical protein
MDKAKPIKTPMGTNEHLNLDMGGKLMDQKLYCSIIGSFLYLYASKSDIMLIVCMCVIFQAAPKECHIRAVKRIMRYLVLTPNLGLWYPRVCILISSVILMWIMPDVMWIGRVPPGLTNSLVGP